MMIDGVVPLGVWPRQSFEAVHRRPAAVVAGRTDPGRRPRGVATVHRCAGAAACHPHPPHLRPLRGVGLVAEAAQGVVGAAGELAGHRQGGPVGVDPRGDVGVIEVVGGTDPRGLVPGLEQRPAQDRRPLAGQVPGVRLPSEA